MGLQSGTSCDGIDVVACELTGSHGEPRDHSGGADSPAELSGPSDSSGQVTAGIGARLLAHHHVPYEPAFARRLLDVGQAAPPELARLHVELGRRFGEAAALAMAQVGWAPSDVAAVAVPGHTAVHIPPEGGDPGATLALGDGDVAAEVCGCLVLADMRARDRAVGGQGAPLVPHADAVLLRRPDRVVAALNLGGIANITVIPPFGPPVAFDTGPANMLLDGALRRASGGRLCFDRDGALGQAGRVCRPWLELALEEDGFLAQPPPRSTGRERYGEAYLDRHWSSLGALSLEDLAATLAAQVVESVALAIARWVPETPVDLVVSGGGARNCCLMEGLSRRLAPVLVRDSEQALGVPVLAREALAFAVLADATLQGAAGNVPSVTGAARGVRLGKLCLPPHAGVSLPPLGGG